MSRPGCAVDKCCVCIPLRNAVLTLGYLGLVVELCAAMMFYRIILFGEDERVQEDNSNLKQTKQLIRDMKTEFVFFMVLSIMSALVSLLPIIGGHMRKPALLGVYFWISVLHLVISTAIFIVIAVGFLPGEFYVSKFLYTIIYIYFLVVIRSARSEMVEELSQERVSKYQRAEKADGYSLPPSYTQY